jgi:hypothetical protein
VTRREGVAAVLLWSVLVFVGTMFGASVYQRISLIPEWGGALPQSVVAYFGDPHVGQALIAFGLSLQLRLQSWSFLRSS